jgi:hypothetical protein
MKLTESQIDNLHQFTKQHYVEYYDVQTELVDHLANDIEEIWQTQPDLSFVEARNQSFKKFGVFGFMEVVEKKQTQMTKKYFKLILKFIKEWFRLPKIVLTICVMLLFYELQKSESVYGIYMSILFSFFMLHLVVLFINRKKRKAQQKKTNKKWLFEHVMQTQGFGIVGLVAFYTVQFILPDSSLAFAEMSNFRSIFIVFVMTFFSIMSYVSLVVIPNKAEELLSETYPEYKIS